MSDVARKCTECENPVAGRALTCSSTCRGRRSRRIARARQAGKVDGVQVEEAIEDVLRKEITPVVREALTEEILAGVRTLATHLPRAIATAAQNLDDADALIRQRAAESIFKLTAGHKSLVPDINEGRQQELNVFFGVPRAAEALSDEGASTLTLKECDSCHEHKAPKEFVANSDRCWTCFNRMRGSVKLLLGEEAVEQDAD